MEDFIEDDIGGYLDTEMDEDEDGDDGDDGDDDTDDAHDDVSDIEHLDEDKFTDFVQEEQRKLALKNEFVFFQSTVKNWLYASTKLSKKKKELQENGQEYLDKV